MVGKLWEQCSEWYSPDGGYINVVGTLYMPTYRRLYQCCGNTVYAHLTEAISIWWESCGNSVVNGTRPTEAISMSWGGFVIPCRA